jgi:hypothetical protein
LPLKSGVKPSSAAKQVVARRRAVRKIFMKPS